MIRKGLVFIVILVALMLWLGDNLVRTSEVIPSYAVKLMGPGYPEALNNLGEATGWVNDNGVKRAWVYTPGEGYAYLPVPAGLPHATAYDLNDSGEVVGSVSSSFYASGEAVVWRRTAGSYAPQLLGTLPGYAGSVATAINNGGDIVGYLVTPGYAGGPAVLFTALGGIENLDALGFTVSPADINDGRQVVGGQLLMDLNRGLVENLGLPGPAGDYLLLYSHAINESGQVAGAGVLASASDDQQTIVRYSRELGWEELSDAQQFTAGYDLNEAGDVAGEHNLYCPSSGTTALTPVVFLEGFGLYCLNDLIAEEDQAWSTVTSFGISINDQGQIATVAQNSETGELSAVLLEPAGAVPAPEAPGDLAATAHIATWQQPWNAIELTWTDHSAMEVGYLVERREQGAADWAELASVEANNQYYQDLQVQLGVTYEYQVIAFGLGGYSSVSNIATATAPGEPVDSEPPAVSFVEPPDGAQVEGRVRIVVEGSDDVGLQFLDVSYESDTGQGQICSASPDSATHVLTCDWQTTDLLPGAYLLTAYASDLLGNEVTRALVVMVGGGVAMLRVDNIELAGQATNGAANVQGTVKVVDQHGDRLASVLVVVAWILPDQTTVTHTAYTNGEGEAAFEVRGGHGAYGLTVNNVVLAAYSFDQANSALQAALTVP